MANETPQLERILESPLVYTLSQVEEKLAQEGFILKQEEDQYREISAAVIDLSVQATGYQPNEKSETMVFQLTEKDHYNNVLAVYVNTLDEITWAFDKTPTEVNYDGKIIPVQVVGIRGRTSIKQTYQETLQAMLDYDNRPRSEPVFRGRALVR